MNSIEFEVCVQDLDGVRVAQRCGATRVELCSNLQLGGTTPSAGLLLAALEQGIDVVLLLRPRSGDFTYSDAEFDALGRDLVFARQHGAAGAAVGVLTHGNQLDLGRCAKLIEAAESMPLTLHRAFDFCQDPIATLDQAIELGFKRILTSGGAPSAEAGSEILRELVLRAGKRIQIMPGGGVSPDNVAQILRSSGARAVHFSASEFLPAAGALPNAHLSLENASHPTPNQVQRTSERLTKAILYAAQT